MRRFVFILSMFLLIAAGVGACSSPYRVHKRVAHRAAKHVTKPPMTILDFSRRGCGCK
ncbi:MAG: hypothetical protein IPP17_13525 [Bacteroidetes bacterium]|nr:hypothetical protein [Bacteroidota bacterium]